MGADFATKLGEPMGGMGPMPQPMAGNSPDPMMQNLARGQDPMANGMGSIREKLGGKMQARPGNPMMPLPQTPGPATMDAGTPAGANPQLLAALMQKMGGQV